MEYQKYYKLIELGGHKVAVPAELGDFCSMYDGKEKNNRRVGEDCLIDKYGDHVRVSTVFLSMNHAYTPNEEPLIFETMIFGGKHDEYQERYSTWDEAVAGHQRAIDLITEKIK